MTPLLLGAICYAVTVSVAIYAIKTAPLRDDIDDWRESNCKGHTQRNWDIQTARLEGKADQVAKKLVEVCARFARK